MIAGLLLLSFLTATVATAAGIGVVGLPLWTVLILFPFIGSATLLAASVLIYAHPATSTPPVTAQNHTTEPQQDEHALA